MRIGISTSVIQRGKTGVAQYVFALVRALRAYAAEHKFFLFVLEEDVPFFKFVSGEMQLITVPERARPPVKNIIWHQWRLPTLAREHQLDLLHVPSYRRLVWRRACGLVGTIHDLAPFHVPQKYNWTRMFYARVIVRRLAHRQDALIAISDNTARDIVSFFKITREHITLIHNGIDHDRFFPGSSADAKVLILKRYKIECPFFLYVARLEHPGKNHVRLISAFEEFKAATHSDWQLVFGGSDWHGAEVIHAAIASSPFAKDIRCIGFVPDQELPDLYRAANAFVYPSLYEGFGLPPVEAMACACPVITSTRGSLGEVVGDAAAINEPEDIHSIAKQLYIVATDEGCKARLRAAGMAQAQKYDWSRAAAMTLNLYERVASSRLARSSPASS